ncbi:MAG: nucleotidyltransferase domain-containing protein [bacterium]|nr:nucleotidyltransferase domain-containing protein [bacterium]
MINIKQEHINILYEIFNNYCPKAEIWAYGSRVNGDSHSGSDFDLTIKSFNSDNKHLSELKKHIEESDIPFLVDITVFENLPKSFQNEITKKYIKIFPQNKAK